MSWAVVDRSKRPRLRLTPADGILWAWLSQAWSGWRSAMHIVQPTTVIAWHWRGLRLVWEVEESTAQRTVWYTTRRTRPDPRAVHRESALGRRPGSTGAAEVRRLGKPVDCCQVHAATATTTVTDVPNVPDESREPDHGLTDHPTADWTAQQLRNAFSDHTAPAYLLHDRDASLRASRSCSRMNIQAFGTRRVFTLAERLRRARHWVHPTRVSGPRHRRERGRATASAERIRRILPELAHASRAGQRPTDLAFDRTASAGRVVATPQVGGIHHHYDRVAA
jgi:hypothetical protein